MATVDKCAEAIKALAEHKGSSRQAIVKYFKNELKLDNAQAVAKALKGASCIPFGGQLCSRDCSCLLGVASRRRRCKGRADTDWAVLQGAPLPHSALMSSHSRLNFCVCAARQVKGVEFAEKAEDRVDVERLAPPKDESSAPAKKGDTVHVACACSAKQNAPAAPCVVTSSRVATRRRWHAARRHEVRLS